MLLAQLEQSITRLPEFVLKVKTHHCKLCLGCCEVLKLLLVLSILILNLHQVLERLLEELYGIDENSLLRLMLDHEVEDFIAEVCACSGRKM